MPLQVQFFVLLLVGWVSRQQQAVVAYLKAENRVLREQLGGGRLRFTDAQRGLLAIKGKALARISHRLLALTKGGCRTSLS